MAKRKQYSIEYKSKVALAAIPGDDIPGDGTIAELSQKYGIHFLWHQVQVLGLTSR
jgi:hypothetical protein